MSSSAGAPLNAPALVMSDSGDEGLEIPERLLCVVVKGEFDRTHKNLATYGQECPGGCRWGASGGGAGVHRHTTTMTGVWGGVGGGGGGGGGGIPQP